MNNDGFMAAYQQRINSVLERDLPSSDQQPRRLHEAMRYAVLNGGKRIRPLLVYATGKIFDVNLEKLDVPACAVEFIHAYSLVHDDLPAMDNDDLRRGLPTCHKAYDEATAILVGDALQTLAFAALTQTDVFMPLTRLQMLAILINASGSLGMVGGQALELNYVGSKIDIATLEQIHRLKTGALIAASVKLGALSCDNCSEAALIHLTKLADCIGLAFQIHDDILDIEGNTLTLGKQQGKDLKQNKYTYPIITSIEYAKSKVQALTQQALAHLEFFGDKATALRELIYYIIQRNY